MNEQEETVQFCMLRSDALTVVRSITVSADLTWYAHVLGKVVPRANVVIQSLQANVSSESFLQHVLLTIQSARLCPGNPEEHFVQLLERKGGKVYSRSGNVRAFVDDKEDKII